MNRKLYQPSKNQLAKWGEPNKAAQQIPSDDEFKTAWKKRHNGSVRGWGIAKRDYIVGKLAGTYEYQSGLWQGRIDKICGIDYQKIDDADGDNINAYNLGYYRGYTNWESDRRGMDSNTIARLESYRN